MRLSAASLAWIVAFSGCHHRVVAADYSGDAPAALGAPG